MDYKTILVHVDGDPRSAVRLNLAVALARRWDAHLVGLNVQPLFGSPLYAATDPLIVEHQHRAAEREAREARALFDKTVAAAGLAGSEWREDDRGVVDALVRHARYADLLVLGQREPRSVWSATAFTDEVLLAAGRPALVVPWAGDFATLGRRVLVAWNAGREAARALTDALPLLRDADIVRVLTVNARDGDHGDMPGADIALYLARHGLKVEVVRDEAVGIDIGAELLSRAADFQADLLVMGAWGHSRMRELVLGGATRSLLGAMTLPVLMSH